jgi:transposase InsO family protein
LALDRNRPAARDAADVALAGQIKAVHATHDGTYGAPRITAELQDSGLTVNHKRVARVMRRFRVQGLFAAACAQAGVRQSMSKVGSSADNALAESFNATFKRETLQGRRAFTDERQGRLDSFRWLHRYNTVRRH